MFKLLAKSFRLTLENRILLFLTYALNFVFGLVVMSFFYKILITEAGGSIVLNQLIADFDYMVFSDFMRVHGSTFTPVMLSALALGGLYYFVNVFITGGIFHQYKYGGSEFRFKEFLKSGLSLFGKYWLLAIIVFLIGIFILAFSGILIFAFVNIAEGGSEREYILWMIPPLTILIFMFSVLTVISDYARYLIFENRQLNPVTGFGSGVSYVFKNFKTVGLYWLILGAGISVVLVYMLIDSIIGMRGEFTILLMIIVQQSMVFGRAFVKNWNYALVHTFYVNNPVVFIKNIETEFTDIDDDKPLEVD
jgi:hypothetical protein